MLAENRFYKTTLRKEFIFRGQRFTSGYYRYSYESATRILDVDVRASDGARTYHVNCGFDTEPNAIHRAIENHFAI